VLLANYLYLFIRMSKLITRQEIAAMTGYSTQYVRETGLLPKPVKKVKNTFFYVRDDALAAFYAKHDHRKKQAAERITTVVLQATNPLSFVAFMRGDFDRDELKHQYKFKKYVTARKPKPITKIVQLRDEWT
jgi:hypothetical protein